MSLLIRNATILAMDGAHGSAPFKGDILVERDRIAAIGDNVPAPDGTEVIDGTDKLVIPGLVNAHLHSWEAMSRGATTTCRWNCGCSIRIPFSAARRSTRG